MDVANAETGHNKFKDDVGDRCQKLFLDFLEGYFILLILNCFIFNFFYSIILFVNKIKGFNNV